MHYNADPDFVMHYCIQETALSPLVRRMTFSTEHGEGVMCLLELWTGVQVWTISDIADAVGYENQGKFGAAFRRETGVTPLEYRRLYRIDKKPRGRKL